MIIELLKFTRYGNPMDFTVMRILCRLQVVTCKPTFYVNSSYWQKAYIGMYV